MLEFLTSTMKRASEDNAHRGAGNLLFKVNKFRTNCSSIRNNAESFGSGFVYWLFSQRRPCCLSFSVCFFSSLAASYESLPFTSPSYIDPRKSIEVASIFREVEVSFPKSIYSSKNYDVRILLSTIWKKCNQIFLF